MAVLLPLSFDSARPGAAGVGDSQAKRADPEPAAVLLEEEVSACDGCLVGWPSSESQHNEASGCHRLAEISVFGPDVEKLSHFLFSGRNNLTKVVKRRRASLTNAQRNVLKQKEL